MEYTISFAAKVDEERVRELLVEHGMDIAGEIEGHVIIRQAGNIYAAGKLMPVDKEHFHLEVLGVDNNKRRSGLGGLLLTEFTRQPWKYCLPASEPVSGQYTITTVAKGDAAGFYLKQGFKPGSFSMLAFPYNVQCDACPERETCGPQAMVFTGQN